MSLLQALFGCLTLVVAGANFILFATAEKDVRRPWLRYAFLAFAGINSLSGLYMILSLFTTGGAIF